MVDYHLRDRGYTKAIAGAMYLRANDPEPDTAFLNRTITHGVLSQAVGRQLFEAFRSEKEEELAVTKSKYFRDKLQKELDDMEFPSAQDGYGELQRFYNYVAVAKTDELAALALVHAINLEANHPEMLSAKIFTDRSLELMHATNARGYDEWKRAHPQAYSAATAAKLDLDKRYREAKQWSDLEKYNKEDNQRLSAQYKRGASLGTSKVTVALPQFRDRRSLSEESVERSAEISAKQTKLLKSTMRDVGIRGDVLSDHLSKNSAEELRDVRLTRDFMQQFLYLERFRLIPNNYDRFVEMMERREAEKMVLLVESNAVRSGVLPALFAGLYLGPLLPYNIIGMAGSKSTTGSFSTLVIDPYTRRIDMAENTDYIDLQWSARQRAMYYELFHHIKRQPKR